MEKTITEMSEIKEILTNYYQGADSETKKRIRILLKRDYVDRCKCPKCGEKFDPDENMKSGIIMYPESN